MKLRNKDMYKNIHFNPKINTIEDVLKRADVQGLEFEKVVYCNEYEAVAVFIDEGSHRN